MSFRPMLGHANYKIFEQLFAMPSESTVLRNMQTAPALELGVSNGGMNLTLTRFELEPVVISIDAARCLRCLDIVKGLLIGIAPSLNEFLDHDHKRCNFDLDKLLRSVPRPDANSGQDEFTHFFNFVKRSLQEQGWSHCSGTSLWHRGGQLIVLSSCCCHPSHFPGAPALGWTLPSMPTSSI
jgi:hypothetical protein